MTPLLRAYLEDFMWQFLNDCREAHELVGTEQPWRSHVRTVMVDAAAAAFDAVIPPDLQAAQQLQAGLDFEDEA